MIHAVGRLRSLSVILAAVAMVSTSTPLRAQGEFYKGKSIELYIGSSVLVSLAATLLGIAAAGQLLAARRSM